MKLFEKVKNMFTEEVEEEVKVEQVPARVKKEIQVPETIDSFEDIKIEKEEIKKPVFFTDHDFEDMEQEKRDNSLKRDRERENQTRSDYIKTRNEYRGLYNEPPKKESYINQPSPYGDPYKEKKEERVFKPTPIISPVYGILDKNYHKEDIVTKKETPVYTSIKDELSVDSVRKKAYGTLEDELENTLFGSNSILFNKKDEEHDETEDFFGELEHEARPDLLDDFDDTEQKTQDKKIQDLEEITMDIGKELNSLLNKKENLKSKEEKSVDDDLFNLIDTMYEGDEDSAN